MCVASYGVMPHTYSLAVPLPGPTGTTRSAAVSYAVTVATVPETGDGRAGDDHDFTRASLASRIRKPLTT